jgi:hypothetical protein
MITSISAFVGSVLAIVVAAIPQRAFAATVTLQRSDTIVKQAGRPVHPGGGTLVPELSIGVVDGADEYMFGSVRDVMQTRDGSILVVDGRSVAVRHYDARGTYVRPLGRRGQGPGEYVRPGSLGELRDGRIVLVDGGTVRVNVYSPGGESVDTWSLKAAGSNVASSRVTVDTTGTIVLNIYAFGGGITEGARLLRLAPDGRPIDTIPAPSFDYVEPRANVAARGTTGTFIIPFFPATRWMWSPLGYMVTGVPTRYAVELRIPPAGRTIANRAIPAMRYRGPAPPWVAGDPVVSIRHSAPVVTVSDEQRSVERARVEANMRLVDPSARYPGPDIPRTKPPYRDLRVGEDGTIWVQLSTAGERRDPEPFAPGEPTSGPPLPTWRDPVVFDVFEPNGTYLGRVPRPANVTLHRVSRNAAWGTMRDEDDVETVKRFRVVWK